MATSEPKNKTEKNKISITKKNSKAVTNWYRQKKKDPKFHEAYKRRMLSYYQKRKAKLEKNPKLAEEQRKKDRDRVRLYRAKIRKNNPIKYEEIKKKNNEFNKKSMSQKSSEEKYQIWKRASEKYRSTEKGKLTRIKWKQSDKSKQYDKVFSQKYRSDPSNQKKIKKYYEDNKEKNRPLRTQYVKKRRDTDPLFKLAMSMRSRMNLFIKRSKFNKNARTFKLIGCSPDQLKEHIEKQFKYGMTWKNHGDWHIDHIKPLSLAKSTEEMNKLFHFSNLQPLWALENIKKSNKTSYRNNKI